MAPRTRAAKARAAAAAEATCLLLDLSHDEQSIVTHELCDPLRPLLAVHLSSTAKGLREPMQEQLAELRRAHFEAKVFTSLTLRMSCAALSDVSDLRLGGANDRPLIPRFWSALGNLAGTKSLPRLERLEVNWSETGDEGVERFAEGLRRGCLPSLRELVLSRTQIGPQGATALATALTKAAVPALRELYLAHNHLGDAGVAALAAPLRRLRPSLRELFLHDNGIGDAGLAALVAPPTAGVLEALEVLWLDSNEISDDGCAALAATLRGGGLPRLGRLDLNGNPASAQARASVLAIRATLYGY